MSSQTWPTHSAPRLTELTFLDALTEGPRVFSAPQEVGSIWRTLIQYGVDPSLALGQFWAESLFATAGYAIDSAEDGTPLRALGNILSVNSVLLARGTTGVSTWSNHSHTYTYAQYATWTLGAEDYCLHLDQYVRNSPDSRYGDTSVIRGATAKWIGKPLDSEEHLRYLDVVLGRMDRYESREPWEGDMAIFSDGVSYSSSKRYAIKAGDRWYLKAGGTVSYQFRVDASVHFMGRVMDTSWFAVRVNTGRFTSDGKSRPVIAYLPNFSASRLSAA